MVFYNSSFEAPPLYKAVSTYLKKRKVPFHVPLQGRRTAFSSLSPLKEDFFSFLHFDLTELPGLDDLHLPRGAIKKSQALTASLFNAGESFFLVNGVTSGLLAIFLSLCRPGDKVLLSRLSHKAALHGIILSGADPLYLPVERDNASSLPLNVSPGIIKKALKEHPEARVLFITSPSYWGVTADLSSIKKVAEEYNVTLVVDEAHGAHFPFYRNKLIHSAASGTDIWLHSAHKSLGALTPAALLHSNLKQNRELKFWLQVLQTSSPSYPLMLSLDLLRYYLSKFGDRVFNSTWKWALTIRYELKRLGVPFLSIASVKGMGFNLDPARVTLLTPGGGGGDIASILSQKFDLQMEMYGASYILAITGPAHLNHSPYSLAAKIADAQRQFYELYDRKACRGVDFPPSFFSQRYYIEREDVATAFLSPFPFTPSQALKQPSCMLPLEKCAGKISGDTVVLSPPGIPVLSPGEVVSPELVNYLLQQRAEGRQFQGAFDPSLQKLSVVAT